MKKILLLALLLCFVCSESYAQFPMKRIKIEEEDASPGGYPHTLKVANGTLTDNGDGTYSFSPSGGSGDAITVGGSAVDTTANFNNDGNVDFTLVDGGAGGPDGIKADFTEVDGSTTNEINTLTLPDANVTAGLGITFAQSGPIAITESAPDTVTFTVTEADPTVDTSGEIVAILGDIYFKLGGDVATAGTYDYGEANVFVEIPNSASLPGTCNVGELYMDTDATSGQRFYLCESANTWKLQGDGGGAETNSLETVCTGIATTEIPIGTAADTVVYAALSGEATMANNGAVTLADNVAVTGWNLTTPTITTSLTTDSKTISEAEIGILDGGIEGTEIISTGEGGGSKFLREDGDGTCSWQSVAAGGESLAQTLAIGADANDVSITSLAKLEGVDNAVYVDLSNDGYVDIEADVGVRFGTAGVQFLDDGDGAITLKGLGDGFDEDLNFNFDDTENKVVASSSTGVTEIDFGAIDLNADLTGNASGSSGSCTGNSATATLASTVTTTDNENTAENDLIPFVADAAGPGSSALETDGNLYYTPSTGKVTATGFVGALTGNADTVTNATLTTALTVDTGTLTLTANAANNSVLTLGAGASSVSGSNTGDNSGTDDQTIDVFAIDGNNITCSLESDGEATKTADISSTTAVTANSAKVTESTTAGRSLTLSTYEINADAELYTDTKGIYIEDPTADDDLKSIWFAKQACVVTSIWAESDQTVTFMLQKDDGSPADLDTVDLAPAAGTAEDTSLDGDATFAAGDRLDLAVTSVSGTPTWVSIFWTFAYAD